MNRKIVTTISSRGNKIWTKKTYPANVDDDWTITVTGSGINGAFAQDTSLFGSPNCEFTSAWGGDIDVSAPSSGSLITSVATPTGYQSFGGTSASAAHVSGAVGLLLSYMNDTTGNVTPKYMKNLAPEDCESIIQMSATDTDSTGYDQLSGYGRLNVGKCLKLVEKPYNDLLHFGTNGYSTYSVNKVQSGISTSVTVIERFKKGANFIQPGKYIVKAFKITSTVYHNISPQDTIVAYWPRPSSSVTWNLFASVGGTNFITPREKLKITGLNQTFARLEGYVYQATDTANNSLGWWPVDTSYNQGSLGNWAEYSVLVKNGSGVHTKVSQGLGIVSRSINLYPNPTSGGAILVLENEKTVPVVIDLYDMMGRKIETVFNGKCAPGKVSIRHDLSGLPNSLYIYNINVEGQSTTRKIIKQE